MQILPFHQARSFCFLLASLILAACGGSVNDALPTPVGMDAGQNTFLYLYTDN